jgi:hypothetical protein
MTAARALRPLPLAPIALRKAFASFWSPSAPKPPSSFLEHLRHTSTTSLQSAFTRLIGLSLMTLRWEVSASWC